MTRIPGLDGIRAIAVLPVMGIHAIEHRMPGGFLGVDLFFVLSGYLITSLLMREERVSLTAFYRRRALRILPPLVAAIALALALGVAGVIAPVAFFYANYVPAPSLKGLTHTWSLAVEEHFYLAWPLLFIALGRQRARLLTTLVAAALCLRVWLYILDADLVALYRNTLARMDALAIGCLAALGGIRVHCNLGLAALAAACVAFLLVPWGGAAIMTYGFTAFAIVCMAAVVAARDIPWLEHPVLVYIGRRSYGLYVYHFPTFMAMDVQFAGLNGYLRLAMKLAATFAIAELSFRTLESSAARARLRYAS